MKFRNRCAGVIVASCWFLASFDALASEPAISERLAERTMREVAAVCIEDQGELWGRNLCGPVLLLDPVSRYAVSNFPDINGVMQPLIGVEVFAGALPDEVAVDRDVVDWASLRWAVLTMPLAEDEVERRQRHAEILWKRLRPELGFPDSPDETLTHLSEPDALRWLRMELRALHHALAVEAGESREQALIDALVFRARRYELIGHEAVVAEHRNEMALGLARYTGLLLSRRTDLVEAVRARLHALMDQDADPAQFALGTGPAYGFLLDASGVVWRTHIRSQGRLDEWLRRAYSLHAPDDPAAYVQQALLRYGQGTVGPSS